tara:strand:+ start:67 stop:462 length:396 start_codon:yes stop_codon:yes gene_type:complete
MKKVTTQPRKKSSLLTAKSKANDNFKESVFSLSGVIRYATNEGAETLKAYVEETEKRHEVKISLNRLMNAKSILSLTKDKEKVNKDGTPRLKWSFWHVLNVVGRKAKDIKGIEWNVETTPKRVKKSTKKAA